MTKIVSITLIPTSGANQILNKKLFFKDTEERIKDLLDSFPVGYAVEIVFDKYNHNLEKVQHLRCIIKQSKRGVFTKTIQHGVIESSIVPSRYLSMQKRRMLKQYKNNNPV